MVEKLIIKDFVGIKFLEIELKKINILIGPQASGKSICAKLLFYFKSFIWDLMYSVQDEQTKPQFDKDYIKKFEEYFPPDSWGEEKFFIRYEMNSNFIEIGRTQTTSTGIILSYSDSYKKQMAALKRLYKKIIRRQTENDGYLNSSSFNALNTLLFNVHEQLGEQLIFSQFFIPAGRSFFSNLQNNVFSFLLNNNALDPFLKTFGSTYEGMKRFHGQKELSPENKEEIDKLIEKILCGKYVRDKSKDFLDHKDGRRISVASSSSGQQETLPLVVMLSTLINFPTIGSGRTIYIEEPEAHLFPNGQRSVIELIAAVFNISHQKTQFFITTHSPYVLTVLNNLLQAGRLYGRALPEDKFKQLETTLPRWKTLLLRDLSAYSLSDGRCQSIVCHETNLIDANIIDEVSNELAIEFDRLLELDAD